VLLISEFPKVEIVWLLILYYKTKWADFATMEKSSAYIKKAM
jgi:hypothetical protein